MPAFVRRHVAVMLVLTALTAWSSYAYFHIDEYFQVLEFAFFKLGRSPEWTLPWEYAERMRPWMQPAIVWLLGRVLAIVGIVDPFAVAFAARLSTGLACVYATVLFLRTSLRWFDGDDERRLHVRVVTLAGFLPFLFVRTSSETAAMAAFTAAFSIVLDGTEGIARKWSVRASTRAFLVAGVLCGFAFEFRYQSAFLTLGFVAWLLVVGRTGIAKVGAMIAGSAVVVVLALVVDRWGYGAWTFPPWNYFRANLLEGAASTFGSEPPMAYLWLLVANVFLPVVALLLFLAIVAWARHPFHPVTWATAPFFLVHNLIGHKEERFVFPIAILAMSFVTMAIGPTGRRSKISEWLWARRSGIGAKFFVGWSSAMMLLLAVWPIGWHHHVRFQRYVDDALGGELVAHALPEFDLGLPAFHGSRYDVDKELPDDIGRLVNERAAREWLILDSPRLHTGVSALDDHATLVWSELPFFDTPAGPFFLSVTERYNALAKPPLRKIRYRSLYRLRP